MAWYRGRTSDDVVFKVTTNTVNLERRMKLELGTDLPLATAKAMTFAMIDAKNYERLSIIRKYSKPTKWTKNATFLQAATPRKLEAAIFFKDEAPRGNAAGKYLKPTVRGGPRRHKGFEKKMIGLGIMDRNEYAMPGAGVKLNQFGNITAGMLRKIITQVQASGDASQNETDNSRKRAGSRRRRMFVAPHGSHLQRGIYQAWGKGKKQKVKPVMIFVKDRPDYRIILPFKRIAEKTYNQRFPIKFKAQARRILSRRNR